MTKEELHALVDIVMDARERTNKDIHLLTKGDVSFYHIGYRYIDSTMFTTFSDFTQAVKEYIKTLENDHLHYHRHFK